MFLDLSLLESETLTLYLHRVPRSPRSVQWFRKISLILWDDFWYIRMPCWPRFALPLVYKILLYREKRSLSLQAMCCTQPGECTRQSAEPPAGPPKIDLPSWKPHSIRKCRKSGKTSTQRTILEKGTRFQNLGRSQSQRDKFSWTSRFQNLKP